MNFNFITEFEHSWANPQLRHALIVHWPVVLSALAVVFLLALALTGARNHLLRGIALLLCVGVMVSGYLALDSGERAEHSVQVEKGPARDTLETHEDLAEKVPLFGAILSALVLICFIPRPVALRRSAAWLAFLGSVITAGWIANTAHYGGHLVYEHGVGTPHLIAGAPVQSAPRQSSSDDARVAFFQTRVKPILIDNCGRCHNPQKARRSGGLDQTSRATLLQGGRSGPAIAPGKPEESLLLKRAKGELPDEDPMPPPPNQPLTPEQIAALEQWIRDGAVWEE